MFSSRTCLTQASTQRGVLCSRAALPKQLKNFKPPAVVSKFLKAGTAAVAASVVLAGPSHAFVDSVGSFGASGFIFKDTVDVVAVDDPEVQGVTIYISEMQRSETVLQSIKGDMSCSSLSDKLSKNFFNDPSQASLACVVTAPPVIKNPGAISGKEGQELFSQGKNLSFFQQKSLRVRRLYDTKRNTVIYIAYSTRLTSASDEGGASTGRYKTSVCAVPVPAQEAS